MARAGRSKKKTTRSRAAKASAPFSVRRLLRRIGRGLLWAGAGVVVYLFVFAFLPVPATPYMLAESYRRGGVERDWVPLTAMAPEVARSVVAAEDANFCLHWGFDMQAIRKALDDGANRGASTISQQTAKNVFLWQGRSWFRKALESGLTPVVEMFWTKKRIIEVYLNVAEMGPGVFGIEAAAQHWFGVSARDLTATQAARIAAALPDPKDRNPARPSAFLRGRANEIRAGAETILADGRSACFED